MDGLSSIWKNPEISRGFFLAKGCSNGFLPVWRYHEDSAHGGVAMVGLGLFLSAKIGVAAERAECLLVSTLLSFVCQGGK
jgi:hypothetical protein